MRPFLCRHLISGGPKWYNCGMTIKKPMKAPEAESAVASLAPGGATIADRFKLDAPDPNARKGAGTGTVVTVVVGLLALAVVGVLTFVLYTHWEFLKDA